MKRTDVEGLKVGFLNVSAVGWRLDVASWETCDTMRCRECGFPGRVSSKELTA